MRRNSSPDAQELLFLLPDYLPTEKALPAQGGYHMAKPGDVGLEGRTATSKGSALLPKLSTYKLPRQVYRPRKPRAASGTKEPLCAESSRATG